MRTLTIIVLMSLIPLLLAAQSETDYQLRALIHIQLPNTNGQGLAGWLVAPNLLEPQPKLLTVGGWLIKEEASWKELMAGALFGTDGSIQPVLNFRSYTKAKQSDFYADFLLRPDRATASSFVTWPISKFRLGLEIELMAGLKSGIKSDARFGPRLSYKIPGASRLTITTSAMVGVRGDTVLRTYLLYNFSKR